jgi:hypothetical protein
VAGHNFVKKSVRSYSIEFKGIGLKPNVQVQNTFQLRALDSVVRYLIVDNTSMYISRSGS